jgi:hypothetical protein
MLLAILAVWFGYKKAKDTGRNPILWAIICGGSFIGVQLLVGLGIGLILGLGIELWGWDASVFEKNEIWINLASIAVSVVTLLILFKILDRVPEQPSNIAPPPPPSFDGR